MTLRGCLTSLLLMASGHQAGSLNVRSSVGHADKVVCVSLAAYETPDYVEALIQNFLHFSEPTTKLAIHFDASSQYNGTERKWTSDRVAITKERIDVLPFQGSVFYAHMLNVRTMEKAWPGECAYWVLQASNMMWVRNGMEQHVREYEFSPLGSHPGHGGQCAWNRKKFPSETFLDFSEKLSSGRNVYGFGQPEGSFFPFSVVKNFKALMDRHVHHAHKDGSAVYQANCYFENAWLQTYALNWEEVPERPEYETPHKKKTPLCLNVLTPVGGDSIPMNELLSVMQGQGEYEGYFAVKRVDRHVSHPTTRFIMNLAK